MPDPIPPLLVRADAGTRLGSGHLLRCLSLALEWKRLGGSAVFLSRCDIPAWRKRIEEAGCGFKPLAGAWPDPADLEALKAEAAPRRPWIVIDGYHFDSPYLEAAREHGRTLVLDDYGHRDKLQGDAVLNQNAGAERWAPGFEPRMLALLGARYALLRPEFLPQPPPRPVGPARKILVSLGGSDPGGATVKAVSALASLDPGTEAVVILGAANTHEDAARRAVPPGVSVRFVRDASDMSSLLAWADCALLAGGTTTLEACLMGLPSLLLTLAENQAEPARALERAGAAESAGPDGSLTAEALGARLRALALSPERLAAMSARGRSLVDGAGARRTASALLALSSAKLSQEQVRVRPTSSGDAYDIWRLSNEPSVRSNSFHPETIPLESHLDWFRLQLERDDTRYWILEAGEALAAQVRYVRQEDGAAEVHFSVAGAFQGKGLGTAALKLTSGQAAAALGCRTLRGVVILPNPASEKAFEKAGYARAGETTSEGRRCAVFEMTCSR